MYPWPGLQGGTRNPEIGSVETRYNSCPFSENALAQSVPRIRQRFGKLVMDAEPDEIPGSDLVHRLARRAQNFQCPQPVRPVGRDILGPNLNRGTRLVRLTPKIPVERPTARNTRPSPRPDRLDERCHRRTRRPREQSRLIVVELWLTNNTVCPSAAIFPIFPRHFFWNAASPTASTSSTIRISGSRCAATANPRRICIPLLYRFTGVSRKSSISANAAISSNFCFTSV